MLMMLSTFIYLLVLTLIDALFAEGAGVPRLRGLEWEASEDSMGNRRLGKKSNLFVKSASSKSMKNTMSMKMTMMEKPMGATMTYYKRAPPGVDLTPVQDNMNSKPTQHPQAPKHHKPTHTTQPDKIEVDGKVYLRRAPPMTSQPDTDPPAPSAAPSFLREIECSTNITTFETELNVEFAGEFPTSLELSELESIFRPTYNDLAENFCDVLFRTVENATITKITQDVDSERDLREDKSMGSRHLQRRFMARVRVRGRSRGQATRLFDQAVRRVLAKAADRTFDSPERAIQETETCFCDSNDIADRAPSTEEFTVVYNDAVVGLNLPNVNGVVGIKEEPLDIPMTPTPTPAPVKVTLRPVSQAPVSRAPPSSRPDPEPTSAPVRVTLRPVSQAPVSQAPPSRPDPEPTSAPVKVHKTLRPVSRVPVSRVPVSQAPVSRAPPRPDPERTSAPVKVHKTLRPGPSSAMPSVVPSSLPSSMPSEIPSSLPSNLPSDIPSDIPSDMPSDLPSDIPSEIPSNIPSKMPRKRPSRGPTLFFQGY